MLCATPGAAPARKPGSVKFEGDRAEMEGTDGSPIVFRRSTAGTWFHEQTPRELREAIDKAMEKGANVRIHLGDPETGRDWLEENDVQGKFGRSMGPLKVPLLVEKGEIGGGALLDHCVVRLVVSGREAWKHPNWHLPKLEFRPSSMEGYSTEILADGAVHARFKTERQADKWMGFIQGGPSAEAAKGLSR